MALPVPRFLSISRTKSDGRAIVEAIKIISGHRSSETYAINLRIGTVRFTNGDGLKLNCLIRLILIRRFYQIDECRVGIALDDGIGQERDTAEGVHEQMNVDKLVGEK
jgi:hypothetical protein